MKRELNTNKFKLLYNLILIKTEIYWLFYLAASLYESIFFLIEILSKKFEKKNEKIYRSFRNELHLDVFFTFCSFKIFMFIFDN